MQKRIVSDTQLFGKKIFLFAVLNLSLAIACYGQTHNLGVGVYPGNPKENFAPSMLADKITYRNIALLKPVYSSSSYDFNLTAQLITDGIKEKKMPGWIVASTRDGILPRNQREYFLDRHYNTRIELEGNKIWVQNELAGNSDIPEVNCFKLRGNISIDTSKSEIKPWKITVSGSDNGKNWNVLSVITDTKLLGDTFKDYRRAIYPKNYRLFTNEVKLQEAVQYRYYRSEFDSPNIESWRIAEFALKKNDKYCNVGGPYNFSSSWKSLGAENEWIYVDLGTECSFDKIKLFWLKPPSSGLVQVSDDAVLWKNICPLPSPLRLDQEICLQKKYEGRYVRLLLDKALSQEDGFILSEMEIYGTGAKFALAHSEEGLIGDGLFRLSGGAWKLLKSSQVGKTLEEISKVGYGDNDWIVATVPGTALISYYNAGIIPDLFYSDNQLLISDSYFYSDFIYRDEFIVPDSFNGKTITLNFDGINWKADVFLNGSKLGRIEGAFTRGCFDITHKVFPGKKNALAVYIYKNDAPGFVKEPTYQNHDANGGELGIDNPTFHASVGWDWMPSIRGRNIGIWNDVFLSTCRAVSIEDPFISTKLPLPDTSSADLKVQIKLRNHSDENVKGKLKCKIGDHNFELPVSLSALETKTLSLDQSAIPELHLQDPALWWPNGYGKQNLYDVKFDFVSDKGEISDTKQFKTGLREMTYSEDGGILKLWINGKRFIARGGNWGFSEANLRYRSREYDIAVRYQKEMNMNMLRNWVGQTGDDEFFEACDKYGIMIWQDFWLANPGDGPDPGNANLFMQNAEDLIKRIRNHPSIALYCGRNEGNPPEQIDMALRSLVNNFTPEIKYISHSSRGLVSGEGPYSLKPVEYYFENRATKKLHSELGLPNPVSFESLRNMMPDSALWPISRDWGIHDFSFESAQSGETFINALKEKFGQVNSLKEWLKYSQWLCYESYRAIFEAQGKNRMGALIWMSHCAWPSLAFQTYDYYFEPTAAYFGIKKGNEPLHIQWNALTDSIEVVNNSSLLGDDLIAFAELINIDGKTVTKKQFSFDCQADQIRNIWKVEVPSEIKDVYFIKLRLERKGNVISNNFYWNSLNKESLKKIPEMKKIKLKISTEKNKNNGRWFLNVK
ncbi:MAG: beta-glycosidase, partial [Bacteroidota bacterium]|nr:beta-glycosidase [Bacteroidota bacterium]